MTEFDARSSNPWAAVIGRGRDGSRELCLDLVARLRERGRSVGGLRQIHVEVDGVKKGFDLVDIASGDRVALARTSLDPDLCDYAFDEDGFAAGRAWIARPELDVVFIEAGKYEAAGNGHWKALASALTGPRRLVVVAVRRSALINLLYKVPEPSAALELPADADAVDAFADELHALSAPSEA